MFRKLFQRFSPQPPAADTVQSPAASGGQRPVADGGQFFPSVHDKEQRLAGEPLLVYGFQADSTAKMISEATSVSCLAVAGLKNLEKVLDGRPLLGFQAMSPREAPGEAQQAIRLFRAQYPHKLALYGSWSYHVERAAQYAIACEAHGIVMPGVLVHETMNYMIQLGNRVHAGLPAPATVEEHVALLQQYTAESPFWYMQDRPDGPSY